MKRPVIKALSVLLTAVLVLSLAVPAVFAADQGRSEYPIVYVLGRSEELVTSDGTPIPPVDTDAEYIKQQVKEVMPVYLKALATNNWSEYSAALCASIAPVFADMNLGEDGEVDDGSRIGWTWSRDTLWNPGNGYFVYDYCFVYDFRVSPIENAAKLAQYIEDICYVTGFDKVNIVGRCQGATVVQAYLAQYGNKKIDSYVIYCSAANGVDALSMLFSGEIDIDLSAIDRYAATKLTLGDNYLDAFLRATISMAKYSFGANMTTKAAELAYRNVYEQILPDVVLSTYGTCPGFWSMVDLEHYDKAMKLVFGGREEQYAELIEKIEAYHEIQLNADKLLKSVSENGTNIAVIAKYGYQDVPLNESSNDKLADSFSSLENTSYGATCAEQNETLSYFYIADRKKAGFGDYISADKQVDSSTCLFPETTWIVKGIEHVEFPGCINDLMMWFFCNYGEVTVHDNDAYPIFTVYGRENNTLIPMTEENNDTEDWSGNIFESLKNFFNSYFEFILNLFKRIFTR